jgi:hypothetical protein
MSQPEVLDNLISLHSFIHLFSPHQDILHAVYFSLIIGLVIKILLSMTSCLNNGWPSDSTFAFIFCTLESITLEEIFYGEFRTLSYLHSCYNPFSFIKQIIQGLSLKVHQILGYCLWVIVSKEHYNNVPNYQLLQISLWNPLVTSGFQVINSDYLQLNLYIFSTSLVHLFH